MNDSDCPMEGALMWISTRTTYVGDQSFVEVYRFKLDASSLDMTRSFIAPPELAVPILKVSTRAMLLVGDFDPAFVAQLEGDGVVTMTFGHTEIAKRGAKLLDLSSDFSLESIIDSVVLRYRTLEDTFRDNASSDGRGDDGVNEAISASDHMVRVCMVNSFFRHLSAEGDYREKLSVLVNPIKMLGGEVKRAVLKFTSADFSDWANRFLEYSPWAHKVAQLLVLRPIPHWVKLNVETPTRNYSHNDAKDGVSAKGFFKGSLAVIGPIRYGFPTPDGTIDYRGADGLFNTVVLGFGLSPPGGHRGDFVSDRHSLIGTSILPKGPSQRSTYSSHLKSKIGSGKGHEHHLVLFHPTQLSKDAQKSLDSFRNAAFQIVSQMPISPAGSQGYFLYPRSEGESAQIQAFFGAHIWGGDLYDLPPQRLPRGGSSRPN